MIREFAESILNTEPSIILFIWLMILPCLIPIYVIKIILIKNHLEVKP